MTVSTSTLWMLIMSMLVACAAVEGCGTLTHATVGMRALKHFENQAYAKIGLQYPSAFQSGCAFPDWGYNLGTEDQHNASELAHWPYFIQALADHVYRKYPQPWTETAERIIAFLLGQVSHSVADILWHDISKVRDYTGQGFITTQASIYFNGDYGLSHSEADVGAEFAMATGTSTKWLAQEWFTPTEDIHEVYVAIGNPHGTVQGMERGMLVLYAAAHLAAELGHIVDPLEEYVGPFVQENLFDFFVGGVDDSAQWTAACWPALVSWLENGRNDLPMCLVEPSTTEPLPPPQGESHTPRGAARKLMKRPDFRAAVNVFLQHVSVRRDPEARGTFFSLMRPKHEIMDIVWSKVKRVPRKVDDTPLSLPSAMCSLIPSLKNLVSIGTEPDFSSLGDAMTQGDYNGDGRPELVIGAPGYTSKPGVEQAGAIFIVPIPSDISGRTKIVLSHLNQSTATSILGHNRASRFGQAVTTVDLNRDGIDDLVVSEPRYKSNQLEYRGRVYIYLGSRSGISANPSTVISVTGEIGNFTMMGSSLSSGDVDGDGFLDLLIGSPFSCSLSAPCTNPSKSHQKGHISIFLSSLWSGKSQIELTEAPIHLTGHESFNWFGTSASLLVDPSISASPLIMTSSPIGNTNNDAVAPGQFMTYDVGALLRGQPGKLATISTSAHSSKLGWSFASGNLYHAKERINSVKNLALSSPTENIPNPGFGFPLYHAGRVYITPTSSLNQTKQIDVKSLLPISGSERFGRFGWATLVEDYNSDGIDDLIVSAPMEAKQQGRVYFWRGGSTFPTTPSTAQSRSFCLEMASGASNLSKPRFGHSLSFVPASRYNPPILAIGAPKDSSLAMHGGMVYLVKP